MLEFNGLKSIISDSKDTLQELVRALHSLAECKDAQLVLETGYYRTFLLNNVDNAYVYLLICEKASQACALLTKPKHAYAKVVEEGGSPFYMALQGVKRAARFEELSLVDAVLAFPPKLNQLFDLGGLSSENIQRKMLQPDLPAAESALLVSAYMAITMHLYRVTGSSTVMRQIVSLVERCLGQDMPFTTRAILQARKAAVSFLGRLVADSQNDFWGADLKGVYNYLTAAQDSLKAVKAPVFSLTELPVHSDYNTVVFKPNTAVIYNDYENAVLQVVSSAGSQYLVFLDQNITYIVYLENAENFCIFACENGAQSSADVGEFFYYVDGVQLIEQHIEPYVQAKKLGRANEQAFSENLLWQEKATVLNVSNGVVSYVMPAVYSSFEINVKTALQAMLEKSKTKVKKVLTAHAISEDDLSVF